MGFIGRNVTQEKYSIRKGESIERVLEKGGNWVQFSGISSRSNLLSILVLRIQLIVDHQAGRRLFWAEPE